jgi:hypothetical protein
MLINAPPDTPSYPLLFNKTCVTLFCWSFWLGFDGAGYHICLYYITILTIGSACGSARWHFLYYAAMRWHSACLMPAFSLLK